MLVVAGGPVTGVEIVLVVVAVVAVMLVADCWHMLDNWIERIGDRNWLTVSAVIKMVSVTFVTGDLPPVEANTNHGSYLATLTYVYHNPELQMGECGRRFANEDEAQAWANSYLGSTVTVRIDRRNPARSELREEHLSAAHPGVR
jgi:hypothetical protein